MASTTEIAANVHRISILWPEINLQFNHFLVVDDEPLLYHTGMRRMFPEVLEAVKRIIDPAKLRWIGFSHFEVDECGSLNDWLKVAPQAQAVSGVVGSLVNLNDFADRPPRALNADETFSTGRFTYRYRPTLLLPHGWDVRNPRPRPLGDHRIPGRAAHGLPAVHAEYPPAPGRPGGAEAADPRDDARQLVHRRRRQGAHRPRRGDEGDPGQAVAPMSGEVRTGGP